MTSSPTTTTCSSRSTPSGEDDWTTLEDANGHTSDDVGLSCLTTGDGSAWQTNHPFLAHYQTVIDSGDDCTPTGTSGEWNAATGNSGGWQEWSLPIPAAYPARTSRSRSSVVSDPATQGLGAWVDELRVVDSADAPINRADPSFETGIDGWTLPGPPPPGRRRRASRPRPAGSARRAPRSSRRPIVTTNDTVFTGFALRSDHRGGQPQRVHAGGAHAPRRTPQAGVRRAGPAGRDPAAAPPPPPPPPAAGPGPGATPGSRWLRRLNLRLDGSQSLAKARRSGVLVTFGCTARCVVRFDLVVSSATQRRYRLPSRRIGRRTFTMRRATRQTLHVALTRTAKLRLKRAGPISVSVRATWTGGAGRPTRAGTVRLR